MTLSVSLDDETFLGVPFVPYYEVQLNLTLSVTNYDTKVALSSCWHR